MADRSEVYNIADRIEGINADRIEGYIADRSQGYMPIGVRVLFCCNIFVGRVIVCNISVGYTVPHHGRTFWGGGVSSPRHPP